MPTERELRASPDCRAAVSTASNRRWVNPRAGDQQGSESESGRHLGSGYLPSLAAGRPGARHTLGEDLNRYPVTGW